MRLFFCFFYDFFRLGMIFSKKNEKKFKNGLQSFLLMLYYIPVAPDEGDDEVD